MDMNFVWMIRNSIAALGGNSGLGTVTQIKEGESSVDGATRLNQNRRQREEKWDQDDLESSGIVVVNCLTITCWSLWNLKKKNSSFRLI